MKDIFIITSEEKNYQMLYTSLGNLDIHFSWFDSPAEAIPLLPVEKPAALFLVSARLDELKQNTARLRQNNPDIPIWAFLPDTLLGARNDLWRIGLSDFIRLPVLRRELQIIVQRQFFSPDAGGEEASDKRHGELEETNLLDILQSSVDQKFNGSILITHGEGKGEIELSDGQIVNARLGEYDPLMAIKIMSTWVNGDFQTLPTRKKFFRRLKTETPGVIRECLDFITGMQEKMAGMHKPKERLYIRPQLEFEELNYFERQNLIQFREGLSLMEHLQEFSGNPVYLLDEFKKWQTNGWLLSEDEFKKMTARLNQAERQSGLRKLFQKVFSPEESRPPKEQNGLRLNELEAAVSPERKTGWRFRQFEVLEILTGAFGKEL
jgi:hypothetical protein